MKTITLSETAYACLLEDLTEYERLDRLIELMQEEDEWADYSHEADSQEAIATDVVDIIALALKEQSPA
jgi:hypothetical protein